jgi:hypothetical protein
MVQSVFESITKSLSHNSEWNFILSGRQSYIIKTSVKHSTRLSRVMLLLMSGCPCKLDPMVTARELATKQISVYTVGCEPSISPYKDWFMAISYLTSGQYVPLASASVLCQVGESFHIKHVAKSIRIVLTDNKWRSNFNFYSVSTSAYIWPLKLN